MAYDMLERFKRTQTGHHKESEGLAPSPARAALSPPPVSSLFEPDPPRAPPPDLPPPDLFIPPTPAIPCTDCGSSLFWQSVYGNDLHCWECIPPPLAAMVRRRWALRCVIGPDGQPLHGGADRGAEGIPPPKYLATWQQCEQAAWRPVTVPASIDLEADQLPRDEDGRIDWWLLLSDDERADLSTPTPESRRRRCPWCKRWGGRHPDWCTEMRRDWGRMRYGTKHKGKTLDVIPEDYLRFLLQHRVGATDDRRQWLEELQGRERGGEYRTPYWERLVEA